MVQTVASCSSLPTASLRKLIAMGGLPDTLCDAKEMLAGSWSSSNTVLFSDSSFGRPNRPIRQLTLDDCSIKPVTKPDLARYDFGHMWPNFLPDGKHFVYAALRKDKKHDVLLGTMGSETSEILVHNASYPKYVPPGYLFFERNGYLFVQRFNPSKLRLAGDPMQVIPQQLLYVGLAGIANYDVSGNGVLTYQEQGEVRSRLVLRDATGKQLQVLGESAKPGESFTGATPIGTEPQKTAGQQGIITRPTWEISGLTTSSIRTGRDSVPNRPYRTMLVSGALTVKPSFMRL